MVPLIRSIEACYEESAGGERVLCLRGVFNVNGADYLNPEYVIRVLKERFALLSGDACCEEYSILRRRVLTEDGVTEFQ
jgi:hypothetical protein